MFLEQLAERKLPVVTPFETTLLRVASKSGKGTEAIGIMKNRDLIDIKSVDELNAYLNTLKKLSKRYDIKIDQADKEALYKSLRLSLPIEIRNTLSCLEVYWKSSGKDPASTFFKMTPKELVLAHECICDFREEITPVLFGCEISK